MKNLARLAAIAALATMVSPALAQNAVQPSPPATPPAVAPAPDANAPAAPLPPAAAAPAPAPQQNVAQAEAPKFLDQQADGQMLASTWIGSTVYDSSDQNLGDINDILFDADHNATAIVLGVGGFLGIGEKSVAVSIDAVNVTTDENGKPKFVVDATSDELKNAPTFMTLADLKKQQNTGAPEAAPPGGAMSTEPAPATPTSPAPAQ